MLKSKLILLSVIGVLSSVAMNGAFAAGEAAAPAPASTSGTISSDALDACKESKEGDGCMYIKDDTKFTGVCQKHNDKLSCTTIK